MKGRGENGIFFQEKGFPGKGRGENGMFFQGD